MVKLTYMKTRDGGGDEGDDEHKDCVLLWFLISHLNVLQNNWQVPLNPEITIYPSQVRK